MTIADDLDDSAGVSVTTARQALSGRWTGPLEYSCNDGVDDDADILLACADVAPVAVVVDIDVGEPAFPLAAFVPEAGTDDVCTGLFELPLTLSADDADATLILTDTASNIRVSGFGGMLNGASASQAVIPGATSPLAVYDHDSSAAYLFFSPNGLQLSIHLGEPEDEDALVAARVSLARTE